MSTECRGSDLLVVTLHAPVNLVPPGGIELDAVRQTVIGLADLWLLEVPTEVPTEFFARPILSRRAETGSVGNATHC